MHRPGIPYRTRSTKHPHPPDDNDVPDLPQRITKKRPRTGAGSSPLPARNDIELVPYNEYNQDIFCFSTTTGPVIVDRIRAYMHMLCSDNELRLDTGTPRIPSSEIPKGTWNIAFAPMMFRSGAWVLVFRAPPLDPKWDEQTVWYFWPDRGGGSNAQMLRYLDGLRKAGKVGSEKSMCAGDERHGKFWGMVQKAVWAEGKVGRCSGLRGGT